MDIKKTMLCTPQNVGLVRSICANLSPNGVGMFITPVYDNTGEIKYYISSGHIKPQFAGLLATANSLYAASSNFGVTLEQCQAIISTSIISSEEPFTVLDSYGLSLQPIEAYR